MTGVDRVYGVNYHFEMQISEVGPEHESAFLTMVEDYAKNDPANCAALYQRKWNTKEFAKFVKDCEKQKVDWRPKAKQTSITRYVMLGKSGEILANGVMSFPLDATTEVDGGNLFCDVPPSLRRKGYGSYCLALMLFEAVRAGLRRVLVTCIESDTAARRMIEKNRGVLQDIVESTDPRRKGQSIARYWISFS